MLATTFLYKILQKSLSNMHQKRLTVLLEATTALLGDTKLTLTDISRHIKGKAKVKNKIYGDHSGLCPRLLRYLKDVICV